MTKMVYRPARIKDWQRKLLQVEKLRDRDWSLADACRKVGIARSTYWEWVQRTVRLLEEAR